MLGFEAVSQDEKDVLVCGKMKQVNEYSILIASFLRSKEEVAKVTGVSMQDALHVYYCLVQVAKGKGVKVSKRKENIYLLNTNINPLAEAPERR